MNKISGIWFCGLSGSGKSYASIFLEKKIKNSIKLEGDTIRKYLSSDLGYTKKERIISARRNLQLAKILIHENKFPLISNAFLDKVTVEMAKTSGIKVLQIIRHENTNIKFEKKIKNVLGRDIKFDKIKCSKLINDRDYEKKLIRLINRYSL